MKKETEYEINKQKEKQLLVRNEFLYHDNSSGKYNFPIIKKQDIDIKKIKLLSYVDTKKDDIENKDKTIHFYTYDWLFNKVYLNPEDELEKLKQYKYLISPDFSIFTNMPLSLQIESIFKNRWCGAYWQSKGLKVIPSVSWSDKNSFEFCFDGIEEGSIVAVCTYYRENCEEEFMLGYNKMLEKIKPSAIICYDEPFDAMKGNITSFLPTTYGWTKNLSWQEKIQFNWEKHHRNISGLDSKDFKFIKYNDPYVKDCITKCSICNRIAYKDQYGNGECLNCGWKFSEGEEELEKNLKISYPMLVPPSRARIQYKEGVPFKPSFEDFVNGLKFYSEMTFKYKNKNYGAYFYLNKNKIDNLENLDGIVELFEDKNPESLQTFKTIDDFANYANIDGQLLKEIWDDVDNPGFMFCG